MVYKTKFGEIEIKDDDVLTFKDGIPGFEKLKKFAIISQNTDPIFWLVSLEDEKIALPIINPWIVRFDYDIEIPKDALRNLEIENREDVQVWTVLVIPEGDPEKMTINLLAPIIVNKKKNLAAQIVLENTEYNLRHIVKEEMERSRKMMEEMKGQELEKEAVKG